jgi:hypothetical protein
MSDDEDGNLDAAVSSCFAFPERQSWTFISAIRTSALLCGTQVTDDKSRSMAEYEAGRLALMVVSSFLSSACWKRMTKWVSAVASYCGYVCAVSPGKAGGRAHDLRQCEGFAMR